MNAPVPASAAIAATAEPAQRLSPLQWRVAILCALVAFLDGFDTQAIGPAGKAIAASLALPLSALGPVFSASQIGFLIGALGFSALGDRFGRKRLLIATTLIFAVCSLGTALSHSYGALFAFRLLAGLGLGGASPNFVSLAGEYAPPSQRARLITTLWAAVPLGGMAASFASSATLPLLGWRALFYVGAAAPMILALGLIAGLPESREATIARGPRPAPVTELFSRGRALATAWLWLASFMTWTMLVVSAFWTPPLLQHAGWSAANAATVLALNNGGGVVGTVLLGAALTRMRPHWALIGALIGASVFIGAMGFTTGSFPLLALAATLAGFCASAAGGALLAVSSSLYPADARATGVGWALGFGRIGAIVGPTAIGLLVALQWPTWRLYLVIAACAGLAAGLIFLLSTTRAFARAQVDEPQP